jgi:hypothetical protein
MPDVLEQDGLAIARKNMLDYFQSHDVNYLAEDAVFRNLTTGEVYKGREEISGMLHYFYHVAFDAKAEMVNHVITEDKAVVEAYFKGRHIGEVAGIKATQKEVDVPMCVSYDLRDGLITEARIYMLTDVMRKQLGVSQHAQKTTYLVRDIFKLKFGQFKQAKQLLEAALDSDLLPNSQHARVLSDFTGDSYRLVFEEGFDSLESFETSLGSSMRAEEWQAWYEKFKPLVESSHREILKQVI